MIYKTLSSKSVIAKVYRDFKPNVPGWEDNAIEWIGEAMDTIGCAPTLLKKSSGNIGDVDAITIKNHRAKLPCDLVNIYSVEYNGRELPQGTDVTGYGLPTTPRTTNIYSNDQYSSKVIVDVLPGNSKSTERVLDKVIGPEKVVSDYYLLNPDYIQTSFESGHVKIHYEAYPLCSEGYPLVPDHYYFTEALSWFIMRNLCRLGYTHPEINFKMCHEMWCEYKQLASNRAMFPSIQKMAQLMNVFVRLIPVRNYPNDFFAGGETSESIKFI